jgi:cardiolipin synthase
MVDSLLADLRRARRVQITSAYFLPSRRLRGALRRVTRRGGSVELILAGKSDVLMSQLAGRHLYQRLLRFGVKIYEYQPQILHSKLFIMDEAVYLGSANLDRRSLYINYELLCRFKQNELAAQARELFENDLKHSRPIQLAEWRQARTFWKKLAESWAYFILTRVDPHLAQWELTAFARSETGAEGG